MDSINLNKFTTCGGCAAKLGPGMLKDALGNIPKFPFDKNLLVGFGTSDDAAVYKLNENQAIVQTLDFFPPMVDDAYTFGKIAAANSLSDIYAMGGQVKLALNIVCFPENENLTILAEILRGGAEKVLEAGGILCGGHSINDVGVKYGLSVTGIVNPNNVLANNTPKVGDALLLTKPLGFGIIMAANRLGPCTNEDYSSAIKSMETLNKYAADEARNFEVHACTDITGFGLLGHLHEMLNESFSAEIYTKSLPILGDSLKLAEEFYITSGGQKNRNFIENHVNFNNVGFAYEEILFDPQTSGGLLLSLNKNQALELKTNLAKINIQSEIIGTIVKRKNVEIEVF